MRLKTPIPALLLAASVVGAPPVTGIASAATLRAAAAPAAPLPFARVYLALRGCTSCSHCRSTIRQLIRSQAGKGGEARLSGDQVEVVYRKPVPVPLRQVIRGLAENRLHDLSLVDVLFEAEGAVTKAPDGSTRFTLRDTRQSFPVSIDRAVRRPVDGAAVRLIALVEGWRDQGEISLVARELRGG